MRMTAPSVKVAYGLLPLLIKAASVRGAPSYGLMRVHNTDGRPALTGRARARLFLAGILPHFPLGKLWLCANMQVAVDKAHLAAHQRRRGQ